MKAIAWACIAFCTARMYEGGFSVKSQPHLCFCYEAVDRRVPAAMHPFTLTWYMHPTNPEPEEPSSWELLKNE